MENPTQEGNVMTEQEDRAERDRLRMEKKVLDASRPGSIVLAPKARDAWLLTRMVISFDTGINHMRISAGTRVSLASLKEINERVAGFVGLVQDLMRSLGAGSHYGSWFGLDSPDQKRLLASARNSLVFFPKTTEGEQIAHLFRGLDSALCEFKVKAPLSDITRLSEAIERMRDVVRSFHDLTEDITKLTNTRFRVPEGYSAFIKAGKDVPGNGGPKPAVNGI